MSRGHHSYPVQLTWTGNKGEGTSSYRSYERSHVIAVPGKPPIPGSSDPAFRGDRTRYNPEELLVASLSSCHMLWYLHLCAEAGVVVTRYSDDAVGTMIETPDGGGRFTDVLLRPTVAIVPGGDVERALQLHHRAHELCFIANSVNFPVRCEGRVEIEPLSSSPSRQAINRYCPRSGKPVAPDSLTEYRGLTVGFCNPHCRDDFAAHVSERPEDRRYFDALIHECGWDGAPDR